MTPVVVRARKTDNLNSHQPRPPMLSFLFLVTASISPAVWELHALSRPPSGGSIHPGSYDFGLFGSLQQFAEQLSQQAVIGGVLLLYQTIILLLPHQSHRLFLLGLVLFTTVVHAPEARRRAILLFWSTCVNSPARLHCDGYS
jgi:hypothetical protein